MLSYYITSHGLGHATRSCDIIQTYCRTRPQERVEVVSRVPRWFLESRLKEFETQVSFRQAAFDVGMVQIDSITVDVEATLEKLLHLSGERRRLLDAEAALLEKGGCRLVAGDIPWLPLAAADQVGIPAVGVGNFSWDWIYEPYAGSDRRWYQILDEIQQDYGRSQAMLRLPFHHNMVSFPRVHDAPLVARAGRRRREDFARIAGADPDRPWALVLFGELELDSKACRALATIQSHELLSPTPLGEGFRILEPTLLPFADLVASVDVLVSKPGFGIVSDAVVNDKPFIYVEREQFREYPILEEAVQRYLRYLHLPAASLYRGQLGPALEEIWERPAPVEHLKSDGGTTVVEKLLDLM